MEIKTVAVLGANGNVGAQCAAIIASFGNTKIYMLSRSTDKSKAGISLACRSVRSNSIRNKLVPGNYKENLEQALKESDWILEAVSEDYQIKGQMNELISSVPKRDRIVSTVTSGLSIQKLSKYLSEEDRNNYFGTHFFNPPYKMLLCELIPTKASNSELTKFMHHYLEDILLRKVVIAKDSPAFIANRIGFQFLNEAAIYANKYSKNGGIDYIDHILGPYTGRSMSPLETIDYVGLDVHKAIVDNIYKNTDEHEKKTFKLPLHLSDLISKKRLGFKSKSGLYTLKGNEMQVYNIVNKNYRKKKKYNFDFINKIQEYLSIGDYTQAFKILKKSNEPEALIAKHFIARYISYSYGLIGDVVKSHHEIDIAMSYGFNWAPPTCFIELIGGIKETQKFLETEEMNIPKSLKNQKTLKPQIDYRQFFRV